MTLPCSIWHIFYIEVDETMYFISHIGHETRTYCCRKTHIIFCIVFLKVCFDPPSPHPYINFGIWRYVQHIDDHINKLTCQIPCVLENEVLLSICIIFTSLITLYCFITHPINFLSFFCIFEYMAFTNIVLMHIWQYCKYWIVELLIK